MEYIKAIEAKAISTASASEEMKLVMEKIRNAAMDKKTQVSFRMSELSPASGAILRGLGYNLWGDTECTITYVNWGEA